MIGIAEFPESRKPTITDPLAAVNTPYTEQLDDSDVIVCGRRRATLAKYRQPIWYRMRGNLWEDRTNTLFKELIDFVAWRFFAGVIAPDEKLQQIVREKTPLKNVPIVPLPIDPSTWPSTDHTDRQLRLLTLTNADYQAKVQPLLQRIATVNEWCKEHDSVWWIAGNGQYEDHLRRVTENRSHVHYLGYVNPNRWLQQANALLHFSTLDIAAPNAILEGMASELPVVTNEYFQSVPSLSVDNERSLRSVLHRLQTPSFRRQRVPIQNEYLQANHTPRLIGETYRQILQ